MPKRREWLLASERRLYLTAAVTLVAAIVILVIRRYGVHARSLEVVGVVAVIMSLSCSIAWLRLRAKRETRR